jgi:hypothetical protein
LYDASRCGSDRRWDYVRILGCSCTSGAAYFALMNDEEYVDDPLHRIEVANILDTEDQLTELRETVTVELGRIHPDAIALLGSIGKPRSYNSAAERATIETIVRLVARDLHITCGRVSPPTVSARLHLGRSGAFDELFRSFFADEHPPHWADRCKAAAVAVAWQRV